MSMSAVSTITRREVREMLNDWRIVVPIFLLTFVLPLMLAGASNRVIWFVEDEQLAERLVPFAVLVVGFIPSSFSLITALESFVGERERNSLEALLATPTSDQELYLGKLFSSLIAPLLSSYIAMGVFTLIVFGVDQSFYVAFSGATSVLRMALLFATIGLMTVTMVAGAVVISSHISSIRAANLMSSFVLLPTALVVQMDAVLIINDRWDVLAISSAALLVLAILLVRLGLITFNREEILSREHQQALPGFLRRFVRTEAEPTTKQHGKTLHPIDAISRRELQETLTDWRVLVPVFVLTFVIPLALVGGTNFAITFLANPSLIARLIPFAILLVGFIPASFSLIVALESFVGERERNSLEALLAMPIADRDLYTSKLLSSSISPLLTSWCAMLVFSLAMAIAHPTIYYFVMTPLLLIQLLLMIACMTMVMVAGAVVISTHTGSIRAANLLASFVLLPMATFIQIQVLLVIARRWDMLWIMIAFLLITAIALIRTGVAAFNREEILSREHEQFNMALIAKTFGLFLREYQPAGVPTDRYLGLKFSPRRFYRQELPLLLRELRLPLLVAIIAALSGLFTGAYMANNFRFVGGVGRAMDRMIASVGQPPLPEPSFLLVLLVFFNNLRVSLLSTLFSSFTFGIPAFMVPAVAFMQISFVAGSLQSRGGEWMVLGADSPTQFLLGYVIPHGIVELPTFLLCAALGIRIGAAVLCPPRGFTVAHNLLWSLATFLKVWLLVLLPLILISSLIEGLISPLVLQALYR